MDIAVKWRQRWRLPDRGHRVVVEEEWLLHSEFGCMKIQVILVGGLYCKPEDCEVPVEERWVWWRFDRKDL